MVSQPNASTGPIALEVHYTGRVQGVGFRATTLHLARQHPVTGWVRNLADGRVQVLVEGADEAVLAFLASVRERFRAHISEETQETVSTTAAYSDFTIIH